MNVLLPEASKASGQEAKPARIVVVGLGYVGLPLAVALASKFATLGVDIDQRRVTELTEGWDRTREVDAVALAASELRVTRDIEDGAGAEIVVVTVPTPVDGANQPDLTAVLSATRSAAALLRAGAGTIVVYESTVYPGVTEDICGPELERISGLVRGKDFFVGYSPERINPGDAEHRVDRIIKVVAGENAEVLDRLCEIYGSITSAGTFRAASIKAAEAAKVIENAQRDINIAFINEITQIFSKLDISIWDVLDAARTKWNFLPFVPGLVGGHCIGVDPYYLSYGAQQVGYDPQVVLSGREINDGMGAWVADQIHARIGDGARILVLGITFKENVPDIRNTRVIDLIHRLHWLRHTVVVYDPIADAKEALHELGIVLAADALSNVYDVVILAVPHEEFVIMTAEAIAGLIGHGGLLADLGCKWRDRVLAEDKQRWSF